MCCRLVTRHRQRCCEHSQAGDKSRTCTLALSQPHNRFIVPLGDKLSNAGDDPKVEVQWIERVEAPNVLQALQGFVPSAKVSERQRAQAPSERGVLIERQGF